jgi:hypothetical protein
LLVYFFVFSILGVFVITSIPSRSFSTSAQSGVISLTVPPGGFKVGRNPFVFGGSVSDPSITKVYIYRIGSPIMVLGRRRTDLPGVEFPVVNGQFTAYAAFLGVGPNTVRVSYIDKNGVVQSMETQVIYDPSLNEPHDVLTDLRATSLREAVGRPFEFQLRLRNRTTQVQAGVARVEFTSPRGATAMLREYTYNLQGEQRQTFSVTLRSDQVAEVGVYQITATTLNAQNVKVSDDFAYVETYRAQDYPFVDVSAQAGIAFLHQTPPSEGAGASWADFDLDGDYDLFLSNNNGPARLYRNNGDGTFTNVAQSAGLSDLTFLRSTRAGVWGDYDNDGDRDLFVTSPSLPNKLYRNNGNGTFTDVSSPAGIRPVVVNSYPAAWGDYDNDGFLDLYVSGNVTAPPDPDYQVSAYPNQLYHNDGDGTFTEVGFQLGLADLGPTLACQWADFDYDGDVDLFVINDFSAFTAYPGTIYRNDGPDGRGGWRFTDIGEDVGFHNIPLFGMGFTIGDFDRDGDQDYFVSNLGIPSLYRHEGGRFVDGTFDAGLTTLPLSGPYANQSLPTAFPNVGFLVNSWGVQFWDYDLDGWEDLWISASGMGTENFPIAPFNPNWLYHNEQNGKFTNVAPALGLNHPGRTRGFALADYDNDGDLDAYLANNDQYGVLLRNDLLTRNNWIKIELRGTVSNRDALGSRIELMAGGRKQIRLYPNSDPQASQPALEQVFGLADATTVDSITVHWPSGIVQTLPNVDPRTLGAAHKLVITESRN